MMKTSFAFTTTIKRLPEHVVPLRSSAKQYNPCPSPKADPNMKLDLSRSSPHPRTRLHQRKHGPGLAPVSGFYCLGHPEIPIQAGSTPLSFSSWNAVPEPREWSYSGLVANLIGAFFFLVACKDRPSSEGWCPPPPLLVAVVAWRSLWWYGGSPLTAAMVANFWSTRAWQRSHDGWAQGVVLALEVKCGLRLRGRSSGRYILAGFEDLSRICVGDFQGNCKISIKLSFVELSLIITIIDAHHVSFPSACKVLLLANTLISPELASNFIIMFSRAENIPSIASPMLTIQLSCCNKFPPKTPLQTRLITTSISLFINLIKEPEQKSKSKRSRPASRPSGRVVPRQFKKTKRRKSASPPRCSHLYQKRPRVRTQHSGSKLVPTVVEEGSNFPPQTFPASSTYPGLLAYNRSGFSSPGWPQRNIPPSGVRSKVYNWFFM